LLQKEKKPPSLQKLGGRLFTSQCLIQTHILRYNVA